MPPTLTPSDLGISDAIETPIGEPKVYALPNWYSYGDPEKLEVMRNLSNARAHLDPGIAYTATQIFERAGVEPRDHVGQAAALLYFVQRAIYYINEPGERLQDPAFTLNHRFGDCDDSVMALACLCTSVRLDNRFVVIGRDPEGNIVHWVEGVGKCPENVNFAHIFLIVGTPTFNPTDWWFAETTLKTPLGWSLVTHNPKGLPELAERPRIQGLYKKGEVHGADAVSRDSSVPTSHDLSVKKILARVTGNDEPHWVVQLVATALLSGASVVAATVLAEVAMARLRPRLIDSGVLPPKASK
jgi:hypothetical protein